MKEDNSFFDNVTYDAIPLSVIYKQLIRFMKENGIYTAYLEISYPKVKMTYDKFLANIRGHGIDKMLDYFFLTFDNVGNSYEKYSNLSLCGRPDSVFKSIDFLDDVNKGWRLCLTQLRNFSTLEGEVNYETLKHFL